ncbi:MAG TPA: BMP family ABC transporter substrate-binding protein [Myxococcales bacterium]|nr:BMP family ABC transporter substrate-binding protein [Myxococcales bacterium]
MRAHRLLAPCLCLAACHGAPPAPAPAGQLIGIVTDVGGRGDQSFNDGALRGLESWACALRYTGAGYAPLDPAALAATIPDDLRARLGMAPKIAGVAPYVLQARAQEDYRPDLERLAQRHVALAVGVGFMLEDAVAAEAKAHPAQHYLLIDSPILDAAGKPATLPNVESVTFREQEGSYLAGALAGLATRTGRVAFLGGMQVPLIQRFEAGFRAGLAATNPKAALEVQYTGSFDDSSAGKRVAQSLYAGGVDVLFQAAGADGLGAIEAAKEAGRFVIGVDSDQAHLAPASVLTSMVKHVDYAVYLAVRGVADGRFTPGNRELGLAEGGVGLAPVRVDFPGKAAALARVDQLRQQIVAGTIQVPRDPAGPVAAAK